MFYHPDKWAFPLTPHARIRRPAQVLARCALPGAFLLLVLAPGCSTGPRGADRSAGWYEPEALPEFVADTSSPYSVALEPEYVVGVGDRLDIVFLFHTNLTTRDIVVRRDGRISLPYVGDQMAAGVTPMTLDSLLTDQFAEILREPNISVIVTEAAPQKVFVLGEVNLPGSFKIEEQVSMLQSVALAGGFKKGALSRHVVLIRREGVSKIVGVEVDLQSVMDGSGMANDVRLRNYDIVFVPQNAIYSAADFMNQVYDILNQPLDLVFKGWSIANLSASYEFFRNTAQTP